MLGPIGRTALLIAAATLAPSAPARAGALPAILFHADLNGRLAAPACGATGPASPDDAALVATLDGERAAAAARNEPPPLALLGGNWAGPDPFAAAIWDTGTGGPGALAALLPRGNYDAVAVGHEELSLEPATLDALLPRLAAAGLPLVASNLSCDARRPACAAVRREVLVRRGDAAIGVLAVISPSVKAGIPSGNLAGLDLTDPVAAIRDGMARLRAQGATRIVVMTDGPRDTRALDEVDSLARQLPAGATPDLLLAAGLADQATGRTVRLLRRDGTPPIVGSRPGAAGVSLVRLTDGDLDVQTLAADPAHVDPAVEALLAPVVRAFCQRTIVPLAPAPVRGSLTRDDFVKYVLEVLRKRAHAEIAIVNTDFIKQAAFPITGTFTVGDLERALPYRAVMGAGRVQGPNVESVLAPALANPKAALLGLAHGSGGLEVNGRALDKTREYRVATIAFVAGGGDGILAPRALPFTPLPGSPDLRDAVASFLRGETAAEDGDPTVSLATDFGRPAFDRPLVVVLGDGELDYSETSISNTPAYTDTQLTRTQAISVKGEATVVGQLRHPLHEADARFDAQYGWARTQPLGMPAVSGESADLITAIVNYSYRGLRDWRRFPKPAIPDPYARVWLESEFTRPTVTPTQTRTYHHLQLTNTAGAQWTLTPRLRVRGGAGVQSELLAPDDMGGGWHAVIEAGATLDPTALATWGALVVKLEGLVNYDFADPTGLRQHELRASGKLSVPLTPTLFFTAGLEVFGIDRQRLGWGSSYDTTIGLRLHTDVAHQRL